VQPPRQALTEVGFALRWKRNETIGANWHHVAKTIKCAVPINPVNA
jgi:hypothetical protein